MADLPSTRKPFSARTFLAEKLAYTDFQHLMLEDGAADFSGGYFPVDSSPFTLFKSGMTKKAYLHNLEKFIRGVSDTIAFYLVTEDAPTQIELGLFLNPKGREIFEQKKNASTAAPKPRILLDHLMLDELQVNDIITREFGFDFLKAATRVQTLREALKNSELHKIKPYQRVIIKSGPQILREIGGIAKEESKDATLAFGGMHQALINFMKFAEVETEFQYPQVAENLNSAMKVVIERLQWHIDAAMVGTRKAVNGK